MSNSSKIEVIAEFRGEYYFLSNFFPAPQTFNGVTFQCAEAAFQAQKEPARASEFADLDGRKAKALGRRVYLPYDWNDKRVAVMEQVVSNKFAENPNLAELLLATGEAELIEGNNWNDCFWGMCRGKGKNNLGKILMQVRAKLRGDNA